MTMRHLDRRLSLATWADGPSRLRGGPHSGPSGFTLVEMLVAVALVVLMMSLFAQVFDIAAGTIHTQRGIAENDQRARSLTAMLNGDLSKRTYRQRQDVVTTTNFVSNDRDAAAETRREAELANVANRLGLGIVPLHPDYVRGAESGEAGREVDAARERGYFYISENDPFDDADDVLQFTVDSTITELGNDDTTPYVGRARRMGVPAASAGGGVPSTTWNVPVTAGFTPNSPVNLDQPLWDDGIGFKADLGDFDTDGDTDEPISFGPGDTGTSRSSTAEISLFVRNGNLYRRVLLIRQPLTGVPGGGVPPDDGQPTADPAPAPPPLATDFMSSSTPGPQAVTGGLGDYNMITDQTPTGLSGPFLPPTDFWNDFDFSATRFDEQTVDTDLVFMRFNVVSDGQNDLDNSVVAGAGARTLALGSPQNRFGHDPSPRQFTGASRLQGRPKEHLFPGVPTSFLGRYTHEETSSPLFGFPGLATDKSAIARTSPEPPHTLTPMSPDVGGLLNASLPVGLRFEDANANSKVDRFEGGPREGEDILMTNVQAFDIKVWDDAVSQWVDLGHGRRLPGPIPQRGDWHVSRLNGVAAGSAIASPSPFGGHFLMNRFQAARQSMVDYGSLNVGLGPDNQPGIAGVDDDADGANDNLTERGWPGSDDLWNRVFDTWHPQFNFNTVDAGPVTSPPAPFPVDDPFPLNDVPPHRPLWSDRDNFDLESGLSRAAAATFNLRARPVVWQPSAPFQLPIPRDSSISPTDAAGTPPCRCFPRPLEHPPMSGTFLPGHQSLFYQVVDILDDNSGPPFLSGGSEPAWPKVAGEKVHDGELVWQAFNNTVGLKAIQITIRFLDPTSGQLRQLTLIHPFVEL
jgi:prepilin-type N-terminal cleavage/methylation domain-containing protein